ncbi:aspartic peptidase domain-containing protein [Choanephora cucurbitarum]|nr:aspartic peptidase domain-containing protein [Choanephora cucurbitarum]
MKFSIVEFAAITQLVLLSSAHSVQKIPLYYQKRHHDFVTTGARELKNGMLGGLVEIGSPPQKLILAFDTSKGFTWVRTIDCQADNCQGRCSFKPKLSTTYRDAHQLLTMDYGKGIVNTSLFLDTFKFGDIKVDQMPIGGAYLMNHFDQGFDGFLGLGRSVNLSNVARYERRSIPESGFVPIAYQQSAGVQSAQFGMYITHQSEPGFSESGSVSKEEMIKSNITQSSTHEKSKPSHSTQESKSTSKHQVTTPGGYGNLAKRHDHKEIPAGYLIIGGVDHDAIEGKLHPIPLNNECGNSQDWAVPVRDAGFENNFHIHKHAKAILSTSTDVIGLPDKQAEEFRKRWYATYDEPDNTFMVPCCLMDQLSSFRIQLGDIQVTLPPHYWSHFRQTDSCCEMCRTHIGKSESEKNFILGSSFTNAFYTQYDSEKEQISLALKKNHIDDNLEIYQV